MRGTLGAPLGHLIIHMNFKHPTVTQSHSSKSQGIRGVPGTCVSTDSQEDLVQNFIRQLFNGDHYLFTVYGELL